MTIKPLDEKTAQLLENEILARCLANSNAYIDWRNGDFDSWWAQQKRS